MRPVNTCHLLWLEILEPPWKKRFPMIPHWLWQAILPIPKEFRHCPRREEKSPEAAIEETRKRLAACADMVLGMYPSNWDFHDFRMTTICGPLCLKFWVIPIHTLIYPRERLYLYKWNHQKLGTDDSNFKKQRLVLLLHPYISYNSYTSIISRMNSYKIH